MPNDSHPNDNDNDNNTDSAGNIVPMSQPPIDSDIEDFCLFWNGNFPKPKGRLARFYATFSVQEQQKLAETMHNTMAEDNFHPSTFQHLDQLMPVLAHMPGGTRTTRLFHGLGAHISLDYGPNADKIYALTGEDLLNIAPPQVAQLPHHLFTKSLYRVPKTDKFEQAMAVAAADNRFKATAFKASSIKEKGVDMIPIVPIPAYLVYDMFEEDVDALELYERFDQARKAPDCACPKALTQALIMVRLSFVSVTLKDSNPFLPASVFTQKPTKEALKWRNARVKDLYPVSSLTTGAAKTPNRAKPATPTPDDTNSNTEVSPAGSGDESITVTGTKPPSPSFTPASMKTPGYKPSTTSSPPAPPTPSTSSPKASAPTTNNVTITSAMFERLLLAAAREQPQGQQLHTTKTSETNEDATFGLPQSAFDNILGMSGLGAGLEHELPPIWRLLGEKNLKKSDKNRIIKQTLQVGMKYPTCRVPCFAAIINMIRDRDFEGESVVSSLNSAVKGLSPFAVPYMTEDQVDNHNEIANNITSATSTTVKDVSANKIKCSIPSTFEGLNRQLKRFCNLVFALFGPCSPMVIALDEIIIELESFNETGQASLTSESFAAILWITMLQARHFSAGLMHGDDGFLPIFASMMTSIRNRQNITHGEVPRSLYNPGKNANGKNPRDNPGPPAGNGNHGGIGKRQKSNTDSDRTNIYNPKMKQAMQAFMAMQPRPSVGKLCRAANTYGNKLFPATPKACIRAQLWGACHPNCVNEHNKLPDQAIDGAIQLLKPVIDNPSLVAPQV